MSARLHVVKPRVPSKEEPKMRRCLAEGHDHFFLTIKAIRICPRGRDAMGGVDPLYGAAGAVGGSLLKMKETYRPYAGLAAYATETT